MTNKIKLNRIKAVLVENDKSIGELCEAIGKSRPTVSRWCSNDIQPTLDSLFDVAEFLGVKTHDLIYPERKKN